MCKYDVKYDDQRATRAALSAAQSLHRQRALAAAELLLSRVGKAEEQLLLEALPALLVLREALLHTVLRLTGCPSWQWAAQRRCCSQRRKSSWDGQTRLRL